MEKKINRIGAETKDDLGRALDAALAKYAAVEPRAGLELRILANLRAQQPRAEHAWWRWSIGVLAAVVLIAAAVAWRLKTATPTFVHTPTIQQAPKQSPAPATVAHETSPPASRPKPHSAAHAEVATSTPKLDVFPSPEPLSEQDRFPSSQPSNAHEHFPSVRPLTTQEQILASYVDQFPEQAALIARAQTALIERVKKEDLEKLGPPSGGAAPQNRQQVDQPNL